MKRSNIYLLLLFVIALPFLAAESYHIYNNDHPIGGMFILAITLVVMDITLFIFLKIKERKESASSRDFVAENQGFIDSVTHLIFHDQYSSKELKEGAINMLPVFIRSIWEKRSAADSGTERLLSRARKRERWWEYDPQEITREKPIVEGYEVLSDYFTDIFPSTHDMDDWALSNSLAEIYILNGISKEGAKKTIVHIKEHFVNHDKVSAIIWFDLYVPLQPLKVVRGPKGKFDDLMPYSKDYYESKKSSRRACLTPPKASANIAGAFCF